MARHIVCVLDRTVGHVSFCWDYVSTFLCNKNSAYAVGWTVTLSGNLTVAIATAVTISEVPGTLTTPDMTE